MQIKQQKQIQKFLMKTFGKDQGSALFAAQAQTLQALIQSTQNKSQNQMNMLTQTILPRIALYQAMLKAELSQTDATAHMRTYMLKIVAAEKHEATAKMEKIPGFYAIYSRIFLHIVRTTDLWQSTQKHDKNTFDVTIRKCLWHTACAENGCPELCRLFCEVDNITYGGLRKLGFSRTQILSSGGDCCDFHFFRK